jgi:enamine deaminase RidA (YjgF/YER057c/UK114 family)
VNIERFMAPDVYDIGTYSHMVKSGNTLYIAGQVARDLEGRTVGVGDAAAQVRGAFENLKRCLSSRGATFDNVVKITLYVVGAENVAAVRAVYPGYFKPNCKPVSTLLVVAGLSRPDMLFEVDATAVLPD